MNEVSFPSSDPLIDYVDDKGEVFARLVGRRLEKPDGSLIGNFDENGEVNAAGVTLILFHEGIYEGPGRNPIAWRHPSEFGE